MGALRRGRLLGWTGDEEEEGSSGGFAHVAKLALCDFVLGFLWVWALATIHVTPGRGWLASAAKQVLASVLFSWMSYAMGGGHFNLLPILSYSLSSGNPHGSLPRLVGRILAQVGGYFLGVTLLIIIFPEYEGGPKYNRSVIGGVLVEGIFTFFAAIILLFQREMEQSFFVRALTTSIFMATIRSVASTFNGVWMNPGHAFGWACARGHINLQHLLVCWLAPLAAAMFGVRWYDSKVHSDRQRGRSFGGFIKWKSD